MAPTFQLFGELFISSPESAEGKKYYHENQSGGKNVNNKIDR